MIVTVEAQDSYGLSTGQVEIPIGLLGGNLGPRFAADAVTHDANENQLLQQHFINGQLAATDPDDAAASLTYALGSDGHSEYGALTVDADGRWTYTLTDNEALTALAEGETRTETFTVLVADGHGGQDTQILNIVIGGGSGGARMQAFAAAVQDTENNLESTVAGGPEQSAGVEQFAAAQADCEQIEPMNIDTQHAEYGRLNSLLLQQTDGEEEWGGNPLSHLMYEPDLISPYCLPGDGFTAATLSAALRMEQDDYNIPSGKGSEGWGFTSPDASLLSSLPPLVADKLLIEFGRTAESTPAELEFGAAFEVNEGMDAGHSWTHEDVSLAAGNAHAAFMNNIPLEQDMELQALQVLLQHG